jgi:hypothetical protein
MLAELGHSNHMYVQIQDITMYTCNWGDAKGHMGQRNFPKNVVNQKKV